MKSSLKFSLTRSKIFFILHSLAYNLFLSVLDSLCWVSKEKDVNKLISAQLNQQFAHLQGSYPCFCQSLMVPQTVLHKMVSVSDCAAVLTAVFKMADRICDGQRSSVLMGKDKPRKQNGIEFVRMVM